MLGLVGWTSSDIGRQLLYGFGNLGGRANPAPVVPVLGTHAPGSRSTASKKFLRFWRCNSGTYLVPAALQKDWQSIQRLYLTGQYTYVQLAELFDVPAGAIRVRACRQKWKKLQSEVMARRETRVTNPKTGELTEAAEGAVEAAVNVLGKETFRQRIAKQAEKVLTVLSGEKPESLYDCAGFVQVLDKVERVGARAYGLEGQAEDASRCLINLAVLNQGAQRPL
jgi:hypothetical protein